MYVCSGNRDSSK